MPRLVATGEADADRQGHSLFTALTVALIEDLFKALEEPERVVEGSPPASPSVPAGADDALRFGRDEAAAIVPEAFRETVDKPPRGRVLACGRPRRGLR